MVESSRFFKYVVAPKRGISLGVPLTHRVSFDDDNHDEDNVR